MSGAATPAGTLISNVARIDYSLDGGAFGLSSNRVEFRVGEIIDFEVKPAPACGIARTDGLLVVGFDIVNLGNGRESFIPGEPVVRDAASFVVDGVFLDANRNGCYDAGSDPQLRRGDRTPAVDPGGSVRVFVVGTGRGGGDVTLPVSAGTGTGRMGATFAGNGDGGGDAVLGPSGGAVTAVSIPPSSLLSASLVKSQRVSSADGGTDPRRGAIVTYSIEGRFAGSGIAADALIADAIPAGTTYVPGSLMLDGRQISDGAGDDAGVFDGQRISVSLGDVAAPAVRSISFQVRIN